MGYQIAQIEVGGGLNNRDSDFDILDNQASELLNVVFEGRGTVKTRDGYTQEGSTISGSKKGVAMGAYSYSDGAGTISRSKYAVFGTDIYKDVSGTWTAQGRTLTDGIDGEFVQAGNELYYFNGTDAVQNSNNTTWSTLSSGAPMSGSNTIAKYPSYRGGMLFAAHTNAKPTTVYISGDEDGSLNTPEDFSGGWEYLVGDNDGFGVITGNITLGDYTVIFKERAIYLIVGVTGDDVSIVRRVSGIGCVAPKSIATDGQFVYFQAGDGHIYAFDGAREWKISEVIQDTIDNSVNSDNSYILNTLIINESAGVYDSTRNLYILSVVKSGDTVPGMQLVFDIGKSIIQTEDYNARVWTVFNNIPANVWLSFSSDGASAPKLYFADSGNTGKVFEMFNGTNDNSNAIDSFYATKNFSHGYPQRQKDYNYFYIDVEKSGDWELNVSYALDGGDFTGTSPDTINLNPGGSVLPFILPQMLTSKGLVSNNMVVIVDPGRYIRLKWGTNTANHFFKLYSATLYYRYAKQQLELSTS